MRVAIVVENQRVQFAVMQECEADRQIVEVLKGLKHRTCRIVEGQFYQTQGGWTRFTEGVRQPSVMFVFDEPVAARDEGGS